MQTGWKYNQYFYTNFPFPSVYIKSGKNCTGVYPNTNVVNYTSTLHEKKNPFFYSSKNFIKSIVNN